MEKKIALITGGTGFIGTYLSKKLLLKGWKVNIVDLKKSKDPIINKKCNFYKSDLTKISSNHKCFKLDGTPLTLCHPICFENSNMDTAVVRFAASGCCICRWFYQNFYNAPSSVLSNMALIASVRAD